MTVFIAMSISFMCSILEACVLSVSSTDIAKMSEKSPLVGTAWRKFKENIQKPIAVILIINTFSHTIGAALSGSQAAQLFGPQWVGVYSIIFSIMMIQWTEILPKAIGVKYRNIIGKNIAIPLSLTIKAFTPALFIIQWMNKPFEGKKNAPQEGAVNALDDISVLARFASINKMISNEQRSIVEKGLNLSKSLVKDILIPWEEARLLHSKMTLGQALVESHVHHHTRFPLVDGDDKTKIMGYVNFKDIISALNLNPKDPTLKGICRPIIYVNDEESLSIVLQKFIRSYQHIAIVKDKGGKVVGMITLEDIIESIIGEINDEYDILPAYIYPITETRYVAGGGTSLNALKELEVFSDIPESKEQLNDWMMNIFGKIPAAEESFVRGKYKFIARKIRRSKIHEAIIESVK